VIKIKLGVLYKKYIESSLKYYLDEKNRAEIAKYRG